MVSPGLSRSGTSVSPYYFQPEPVRCGSCPQVLHALDARTGEELYNSGDAMETWVHFSSPAVAEGRIYTVDYDSNVYCFGLKGK